jgi:hypothetical protein
MASGVPPTTGIESAERISTTYALKRHGGIISEELQCKFIVVKRARWPLRLPRPGSRWPWWSSFSVSIYSNIITLPFSDHPYQISRPSLEDESTEYRELWITDIIAQWHVTIDYPSMYIDPLGRKRVRSGWSIGDAFLLRMELLPW